MITVFCLPPSPRPAKFKWETSFYDLRMFSCIDLRPFCFIGAKAGRIPSPNLTPWAPKYRQNNPLNFHSSNGTFRFYVLLLRNTCMCERTFARSSLHGNDEKQKSGLPFHFPGRTSVRLWRFGWASLATFSADFIAQLMKRLRYLTELQVWCS